MTDELSQALSVDDLKALEKEDALVGIYPPGDISNEVYHAGPGISKSGLDAIHKSPLHYRWKYLLGNRSKPTPAMEFGSLVHEAILEPERFKSEYAVFDNQGKRNNSKAYNDLYADWILEHPNAKPIKEDLYSQVISIRDAVFGHKIGSIFQGGKSEHSIFWRDGETGEICKCRMDHYIPDTHIIADVKTISDIAAVDSQISKYRYYVQDAFYSAGYEARFGDAPIFVFFFVESKPPYAIRAVSLDPDAKFFGSKKYRENLRTYHACKEADLWPGPCDEFDNKSVQEIIDNPQVETVGLQAWVYYQEENRI